MLTLVLVVVIAVVGVPICFSFATYNFVKDLKGVHCPSCRLHSYLSMSVNAINDRNKGIGEQSFQGIFSREWNWFSEIFILFV